jgi:uncharacterized protein YjbI with pentapeptide repeats
VDQRPRSSSRTIWDLLVVLGVLLVGAAAGYWFSERQKDALQQEVEVELANLEQQLEAGQRPDDPAALQAYLEQMTRLVIESGLRESEADSDVRRAARARTLTVVANLDAEGNRIVTRFLTDLDLVKGSDSVRLLSEAYLPDADLEGAFLPAADLNTSLLRGADLGNAMLISANLSGANLSNADLRGANLAYANLEGANLEGADLSGADLTNAAVSDEQLDASKSLKGATMPDGSKHP